MSALSSGIKRQSIICFIIRIRHQMSLMTAMNACESSPMFQKQFNECAGIECDFSLKALPFEKLAFDKYAKFSNASDCHVEWKPYSTQKECAACPTGEPMVYDGVPIDYRMQSFPQPFEACSNARDFYNQVIKERLLWNDRGSVELSSIPAYKACGPTTVQIKRNGIPINREGIVGTAENLLDPDAESDLKNITKPVVYRDSVLYNSNRPECITQGYLYRDHTSKSRLDNIFDKAKINPLLFNRQLYSEFDPKKNVKRTTPHVFNNCSRAKSS